LAKIYHPDRNPENPACEERFKKIARAFHTLRQKYELKEIPYGVHAGEGSAMEPYQWETFAEQEPAMAAAGEGYASAASEGGEGKNGALGTIAPWTQRAWESLQGCERKVLMLDVEMSLPLDSDLAARGGSVKVRRAGESFEIRVPKNAHDGMVLRIPRKGDSGVFHRKRGDLLIRLKVETQSQARSGSGEFYYQVDLPQDGLHRRRVFTLHTSQGPIYYSLPENTRQGQSFVLRGKPDPEAGKPSYHIISVNLV
ncbi:MAG: DnaJ C-terminal domain-containing protein, partial [Nitrospinaceae bacterium]